jgi:hypothetical protein
MNKTWRLKRTKCACGGTMHANRAKCPTCIRSEAAKLAPADAARLLKANGVKPLCKCDDKGRGQYHLPSCALYLDAGTATRDVLQRAIADLCNDGPVETDFVRWDEVEIVDDVAGAKVIGLGVRMLALVQERARTLMRAGTATTAATV